MPPDRKPLPPSGSRHPPGADPPQSRHPPKQTHPGPEAGPPGADPTPTPGTVHAGRYGQQAGGTHPTGKQTSYSKGYHILPGCTGYWCIYLWTHYLTTSF